MILDRQTLQEIRDVAKRTGCANKDPSYGVYTTLARAADYLDAALARRDAEDDVCRCRVDPNANVNAEVRCVTKDREDAIRCQTKLSEDKPDPCKGFRDINALQQAIDPEKYQTPSETPPATVKTPCSNCGTANPALYKFSKGLTFKCDKCGNFRGLWPTSAEAGKAWDDSFPKDHTTETPSANAKNPCSKCGKPNPILCCATGYFYFACMGCDNVGPRCPTSQLAADMWDARWKPKKQATEYTAHVVARKCPHCGSANTGVMNATIGEKNVVVGCQDCGITTLPGQNLEELFARWNKTADEPSAMTKNSHGYYPCPGCGSEDVRRVQWLTSEWNEFRHQLCCQKCGVKTHAFPSLFDAVEAWNQRTQLIPAETEHRESL